MSATSQAVGAPEQATAYTVAQPKRPRSSPFTNLRLHLANIYRLMIKELRGIRSDPIMLLLVAYSFTFAIYAAATGASTEATNLSVGIVDEDHSDLSRRIADGLTPPTFQPAVQIAATETDSAMNSQRFLFVIEISPKFQEDVLAGRRGFCRNRCRRDRVCPGVQWDDLHPERHPKLSPPSSLANAKDCPAHRSR